MLFQKMQTVEIDTHGKTPKEMAQELLNQIQYDPNVSSVPVVKIAKSLGFSVRTVEKLPNNDSGFVIESPLLKERFGTSKCIFLSKKIKYGKSRFVLAHEIGHYLFDFKEREDEEFSHIYSYNKNSQNDPGEIRASEFASELLMPEDVFISRYQLHRFYNDLSVAEIVMKLSAFFETTPKSVERRLRELRDKKLLVLVDGN